VLEPDEDDKVPGHYPVTCWLVEMEINRVKVSVIIPNYNGREYLEKLLPSIADQTFNDYEVIILDDCSPDRSAVEYIKDFIRNRQNMRLVENEKNLGFAKNCNRGFALASGNYICLLTNDTVVASNFLERNVAVMEADSSIGVLSCMIVDEHGHNWSSGGIFRAGIPVNLRDDFTGVRCVDYAAGTAPFYRREVFAKVGYLNESFYMYHEDVEFCLRVRKKTDYKVCVFHEKLVTHYWCVNPDKENTRLYWGHRNHMLLMRKYAPRYLPKVAFLTLTNSIILLASYVLKGNRRSLSIAIPKIRGTIAGLIKVRVK